MARISASSKSKTSSAIIEKVKKSMATLEKSEKPSDRTAAQIKKIERDKKRSMFTLDLPENLINSLRNLAVNECTTSSQLAALMLAIGLTSVANGKIKLENFKFPSRSMRYEWKIRLPKIPLIALVKAEIDQSEEVEVDPISIEVSVNPSVNASVDPGASKV